MPQYLSPGVYVEEVPSAVKPIAGVGTSTAAFIGAAPAQIELPADRFTKEEGEPKTATTYLKVASKALPKALEPHLITNWSQFVTKFADVVGDKAAMDLKDVKYTDYSQTLLGQWRTFAHAVYGFFANGGTRCYVLRIDAEADLSKALAKLAAIDEVAIVAAPGLTSAASQNALAAHCESLQDRFAVLDPAPLGENAVFTKEVILAGVNNSAYAALYFPWIKVFDPAHKMLEPTGDGLVTVPPSGHIAGIYARVDTERGVHKAPANEAIRGALDVEYLVAKADQDGLNPAGVNVIRKFDGGIKVWGARTVGGDANADLKYVNVRRLLNFLRESIDEGTQWVVFEPNDMALWAKITRNVTAFLTNVWRSGALFGATEKEAFYVKCDAETNPPSVRDLGQVVTEIGVAVVKPAEFVIFRLSQWAGPGK